MEIEVQSKSSQGGYGLSHGVLDLDVSYYSVKEDDPFKPGDEDLLTNIKNMNLYDYVQILENRLKIADKSLTNFKSEIRKTKLTKKEQDDRVLVNYKGNFPYRELLLFMSAVKQKFTNQGIPPPVSLCLKIQNVLKMASRFLNEAAKYAKLPEEESRMYKNYVATYDCKPSLDALREKAKKSETPNPVYHWALPKIKKRSRREGKQLKRPKPDEKGQFFGDTAYGGEDSGEEDSGEEDSGEEEVEVEENVGGVIVTRK